MRAQAAVMLALLAACGRDAGALREDAIAIAAAHQPALDALVARIGALKRALRGNRPGWEAMLRVAELANDELGLPPFTQEVPPGPAWRPSPATLLGIADRVRTATLGTDELAHLVADERRWYASGIARVSEHLAEVEAWLAPAGGPGNCYE